jgi:eukaryotic-like serine/threonine-protein kinase
MPIAPRARVWRWLPFISGGACAAIVAAGAWLGGSRSASAAPPMATFDVDVPAGWSIGAGDHLAISPDGRYLAFTAADRDGKGQLWLRALTSPEPRTVAGTSGAQAPFWSPDGTRIGFFAGGQLKTATLADATVRVLAVSAPPPIVGGAAAWLTGEDIFFMPLSTGPGTAVRAARLRRLHAATGTATFVTPASAKPSSVVDLLAPVAVPGRAAFSFVRWDFSTLQMSGHVSDFGGSRIVDLGRTGSRLVVTPSGHAVYVRDGALVAQPFDLEALSPVGPAFPIASDVSVSQPMLGHFAASSDVIVYLPAGASRGTRLTIVDRGGVPRQQVGEAADYSGARVSPDGKRLAVARRDPLSGTRDIWIHDLDGQPPVRVTFDRHDDLAPAWAADGRSLLFTSDRSGERDIYRKDVTGSRPEVPVFASGDSKSLNAWSPDGRLFVYDTGARGSIDANGHNNKDLLVVSLDGTRMVRPLAATRAAEANADISPDGRLVAYQVTEGTQTEVIVESFPGRGGRFQATTTGGSEPMWSANGQELYLVSPARELCVLDVRVEAGVPRFGSPRVLFRLPPMPDAARHYAPLPDSWGFVVLVDEPPAPQRLRVLLNWRSAAPR